ncbi:hypothetical protein JNJ66_00710 [Candidatus Saccharibacteria bacterium]|nr:hypothetical protein [Candidatus Saccharibacteria bacterium]
MSARSNVTAENRPITMSAAELFRLLTHLGQVGIGANSLRALIRNWPALRLLAEALPGILAQAARIREEERTAHRVAAPGVTTDEQPLGAASAPVN